MYHLNRNKYKLLKLPDEIKVPSESLALTPLGKDFTEIHESTVSYGSPELEDQNSGAIYMHASIHEDKSSKGKIRFEFLYPIEFNSYIHISFLN